MTGVPSSSPPGPLTGLRVLDMATLFAAPLIAATLGDFGADVVKVEPPSGDPLRRSGEPLGKHSVAWALAGRNKRCISIDFEDPEDLGTLHRLAEIAHVIILNQPTEVLCRWGCTYEDIAKRNPAAVVVRVSMFGSSGPYQDRVGNGTMAEAFGGFAHLNGQANGPPTLASVPLGDYLGALHGVIGALLACYWRETGNGEGQLVDVSLYEPVLGLLGTNVAGWRPGRAAPARMGSRIAGGVPRNLYRTADDQWIAVSAPTDSQAVRALELIGHSAEDELARYGSSEARLQHAEELDALFAGWIATRTSSDALAGFDRARVPACAVNDLNALSADPQVRARRSMVETTGPETGPVVMPGPSPTLSASPGAIRWPGADLDAHRGEVIEDWLGVGNREEQDDRT